MQTSMKLKSCSRFLIAFVKYILNVEYFEKTKSQSHSLTNTEIINCEKSSNFQKVPMQTSLKLKTCSRFFNMFLKFMLNFEYFEKKDQSQSLSITENINCETGSYLNVHKAIFHATLRQITCERVQNTAQIRTELVSYHCPINLR